MRGFVVKAIYYSHHKLITMSKSIKQKATSKNNPVPAKSFGWFIGKGGQVVNVVSKPFTIAELKSARN